MKKTRPAHGARASRQYGVFRSSGGVRFTTRTSATIIAVVMMAACQSAVKPQQQRKNTTVITTKNSRQADRAFMRTSVNRGYTLAVQNQTAPTVPSGPFD